MLSAWGTANFFAYVQLGYIDAAALEVLQESTWRNQFGHKYAAYRWYLDPNYMYVVGDDSWMDRGTTK